MELSTFEPKWQSKPVRDRLNSIIKFALTEFSFSRKRRLSQELVESGFGSCNRRVDKNTYLKNLILKKTAFETRGVECAEWELSWANLLWACNQAGMSPEEVVKKSLEREIEIGKKEVVEVKSASKGSISMYTFTQSDKDAKDYFDLVELQTNHKHLHTENAQYTDAPSGRLITHFQNVSKNVRAIFWDGWYDYDIEAAAYTLIYQELTRLNADLSQFTTFARTFSDKVNFRNELADYFNLPVDTIKEILATLLNRPMIVNHKDTAIYNILEEDGFDTRHFFMKAKKCQVLKQLITEIKLAWPYLMNDWEKSTGKNRKDVFRSKMKVDMETGEVLKNSRYSSSKFRAYLYFQLERKVLNSIRKFMSGKICHCMHDGFFTNKEIDTEKLRQFIKQETGYEVKFSEERIKKQAAV